MLQHLTCASVAAAGRNRGIALLGAEDTSLASLTAKQREVLDLLIEHKTSKEIARALGISPHTVDQRIQFAKRKLGCITRGDLAVRYGELRGIYGSLTYEESLMANPAIPLTERHPSDAESALVQEHPEPIYSDSEISSAEEYRIVPEMFDGRFGVWVRLGAIVIAALVLIITFLGGLAIFNQLSEMFRN